MPTYLVNSPFLLIFFKVYGAFRMYVKMLLMWDSKIKIEGGRNEDVRVSMLEARNLIVLKVGRTEISYLTLEKFKMQILFVVQLFDILTFGL